MNWYQLSSTLYLVRRLPCCDGGTLSQGCFGCGNGRCQGNLTRRLSYYQLIVRGTYRKSFPHVQIVIHINFTLNCDFKHNKKYNIWLEKCVLNKRMFFYLALHVFQILLYAKYFIAAIFSPGQVFLPLGRAPLSSSSSSGSPAFFLLINSLVGYLGDSTPILKGKFHRCKM